MSTGVVVLALAVVLALGVGLWRAATDGRFRDRGRPSSTTTASPTAASPAAELVDQLGESLGERATLRTARVEEQLEVVAIAYEPA